LGRLSVELFLPFGHLISPFKRKRALGG
jgi:hypothetical protein